VIDAMRKELTVERCVLFALIAPLAACSEASSGEPLGQTTNAAFAYDTCGTLGASSGWENGFFPQQSAPFRTEFVAVPFADRIDAVFGLSNGPADAFTDLAAIVRFNPSGFVDARRGSAYAADVSVPYRANDHFRAFMNVDVTRRMYDVDLTLPDGSMAALARGYPFRTERALLSRFDNFARIMVTPSGSAHVCAFWATSLAGPCAAQAAGSPWTSQAFPRQTGRFDVWFDAFVNGAQFVDTVIGLSSGPPARFTDLGPIVRFNPTGQIDVRNGSVYETDSGQPYRDGQRWVFLMRVDVPSKTYSVYIQPWGRGEFDLIAENYAFRTEQSQVTSLAHLGHFVSSPSGVAQICDVTIDYDPSSGVP
jgi:hypothetical protein